MNEVDGKENRQETGYNTDNRLPLQVTTRWRRIVFGKASAEHDTKEGGTNGGHDRYVGSELHSVDFYMLKRG